MQASPGAIKLTISLYILGLAIGQPIYGPLSDAFGRRPVLLAGLALFTLGGIASMVAPDVRSLCVARLVQALGGCAGLVLGRAIVRDTGNAVQSVRRLALINLVTMVGPAMAPLLGQGLVDTVGWRFIFGLLVLLGMCNIFFTWRVLPETSRLVVLFTLGAGMTSPAALTLTLGVEPKRVGSAAGLYGAIQMTFGAACTALAGLGADPALAVALILSAAAVLSHLCFRMARHHPPCLLPGVA